MPQQINIALADDEQLFREGIRFLLEREPNFNVIFDAQNGQELVDFLAKTTQKPDIILMDLKMPILNGVEATKEIQKNYPEIKIITLSSYDNKSFITNMISVGASSYLLKNTSPKTVIFTINEVFEKGYYYNEHVRKIINNNIDSSSGKKIKSHLDKKYLTERETEVLELICKEYTTQEIAEQLFLSPRTVEGHRKNLLEKTESKNMAGLVIYGIQKEVIEITTDFDI